MNPRFNPEVGRATRFAPGHKGMGGRPRKLRPAITATPFEQARVLASLAITSLKPATTVREGQIIWYRRCDGSHFPTLGGRPITEEAAAKYKRHFKSHEYREFAECPR